MRIGEFAKQHGVTQDTVRYYLDMELLVAEKRGSQYRFTEGDSQDMNTIKELKQLNFSLTDIQKLLAFQRLSGANTDVYRNLYLSLLMGMKEEVSQELQRYKKMYGLLKEKISELKAEEARHSQKLGLPLASLSLFACPVCQKSLSLSDGSIVKNMVMDGHMQCTCGYGAMIKNGVYIEESAVRTKLLNGEPMPSKETYLAHSSYTYVNFLYKGMSMLIEYMKKYAGEASYVMELDNCVGFFLMQYIQYLPPGTTYILIDYDLERMNSLKNNLEMYYQHRHFIFLCCDMDRIPLKQGSMDLMVDNMMTKAYGAETGGFLLDQVLPLLKPGGLLVGSYPYYGTKDKAREGTTQRIYLTKEEILEKIDYTPLYKLDMVQVGPVLEKEPGQSNGKGRAYYQGIYLGKKVEK